MQMQQVLASCLEKIADCSIDRIGKKPVYHQRPRGLDGVDKPGHGVGLDSLLDIGVENQRPAFGKSGRRLRATIEVERAEGAERFACVRQLGDLVELQALRNVNDDTRWQAEDPTEDGWRASGG